jgi:nitrous oxidase accessory protein
VNGVGNLWDSASPLDLNGDGINDLPHHEMDLFGALRHDFPSIGLLSDSPLVKLLRYAHERAALPGVDSVEDRASLVASFWKIRARRVAAQFAAAQNPPGVAMQK